MWPLLEVDLEVESFLCLVAGPFALVSKNDAIESFQYGSYNTQSCCVGLLCHGPSFDNVIYGFGKSIPYGV